MATELCFNFWYYLNESQQITEVSAQVYYYVGSDEEKGEALKIASSSDHETAPRLEVEPVHYSKLGDLGVFDFFWPVFELIARALPDGVQMPEEKLYFVTPMYDFGEGFVPARIGEGFITERE